MEATYGQNSLDRRIFSLKELTKIKPGVQIEELVSASLYDPAIVCKYKKMDMKPYTDDAILVRDSIAKMLAAANKQLSDKQLCVKVVYGYRHPEVQRSYFIKRKEQLKAQNPDASDDQLNELAHQFVAYPEVGGHIAGAAVDVTLIDQQGNELDMGTDVADFSDPEKIKTYAMDVTDQQRINRDTLHDAMTEVGFVPFYGEWWHFCYGDREWAAFCGKDQSLFGVIDYRL